MGRETIREDERMICKESISDRETAGGKKLVRHKKIHRKGYDRSAFLVLAAAAVCSGVLGLTGCGSGSEGSTSPGADAKGSLGASTGQSAQDAPIGRSALDAPIGQSALDMPDGQSAQDALADWGVQAGPNALDEQEEIVTVVRLDHELDDYQPLKQSYNFYFTYKTVHPWWDAVELGIEGAAAQYEERGIIIEYEYLAPTSASTQDQIRRLTEAASRDFDVIGVDVADVDIITPVINALIEDGQKVMTFSSSDAPREAGCQRIAYVGNTHNYEDGAALAEILCERLGYRGKVAVLVGTEGAPCHEERALGVQDVIARYPDMEIVAIEYDDDLVEKASQLTEAFLERYDDLAGIVCCNMSNPVGAARAVLQAGREEIVIVGMDHDREALQYLRDGTIYALGVQDCYSIGFDTLQVAVKIADGILPGELYPEKTEERTTMIYQEDAVAMLQILYGEIDR